MMRISTWHGDLSDAYLRFVTQLGVDCLDFGDGGYFPGVAAQGYPDLDELRAIQRRLRTWGLEINRVTLPDLTEGFMEDRQGGDRELENACQALKVFGQAGVPLARQRFAGGSSLILDEINHYGRKGRIAMVHLRNVRGSLAAAGSFEETLMDDGDLNLFKVLLELRRAGFDGCINPDHIPTLEGDGPHAHRGLAYSVGYLKALLAALAAV